MLFFRMLVALIAANRQDSVSTASVVVPEELSDHQYAVRLRERERELASLNERHRWLWICFTTLLLFAVAAGALALSWHVSTAWILPPLAGLFLTFWSINMTTRAYSRAWRIVRFYEFGIARLSHQWQGGGDSGEEFLPNHHLYARDLDLFGQGSLFEYLCTTRTGVGGATLATWLLNPAEPQEIALRQQAVVELRGKLALQEEWAATGSPGLRRVEARLVEEWAKAPDIVFPRHLRVLALLLPGALLVAVAFALTGSFPSYWLLATTVLLTLEATLALRLLRKTRQVAADVGLPAFELGSIAPLLEVFQEQNFECPLLTRLQNGLADRRDRAAGQIRPLRLWTRLLELRQSEYFAAILSLFLCGTNLAILIERWRQQHRKDLCDWMESLGYFEALLCLARFSLENPQYTFPVLKSESPLLFRAELLGHPLLEQKTCVPCDVILDANACQVLMISGSNMSGKSTLLRSVGLNAVLAFAGAPVRALRLELSPMAIGCSISVHDSLLEGKSRFAAEVERIKAIMTLSHQQSSLVLLDEILGGTNSTDRLFGTEAILLEIMRSGVIGCITTHDLALADLVEPYAGRVKNVHFADYYQNGEMRFDFKMRPGILTHTNGMNVIAALGLSKLLG